jgi:hypothetical protein
MSGKQTPPTRPVPSHRSRDPTTQRAHASSLGSHGDANSVITEETRRSGRANKGQHTKNLDALDEPAVPKTKAQLKAEKKGQGKGKGEGGRSQSTQSAEQEEEQEEEDAIIRCVCGDQRDIRGRQMICCDKCQAWQHNKCLGLQEGDYWEDKTYYCEQCRPEDHQDLLAAMARGEKPWARKKGTKPKARPSDIKIDDQASTPQQSSRVATPAQASAPPVQAPTPTPAPLAVQTQEASNGHTDTKVPAPPSQSAGIFSLTHLQVQSQPQSPLGEKRRHEGPTEKANASKKRRKSSQHHEKTAAPSPTTADISTLPPTQKPFAEKLCDTLTPLINNASDARTYRIPDGETAKSLASRFALHITLAAVSHFGEPTSGDAEVAKRLRAIIFNVKKNAVLVDRMLSGSLKSQDLATMPIEEMASEDKQREFAAMREAAEKQMILTEEAGPRLRKTHKGEELVGEDNFDSQEYNQPELRERESVDDTQMQSPVGTRPPESPANATHAPISVDTATPQPNHLRRASTNFDINSVFDKVRSPQNDQQAFLPRRQSSMQMQEKSQAPVQDADVDRLLKDEDNDVEMSGYSSDPTVCWQGSIGMQSMQPFDAVARFVAGGDFGQVVPWDKLISNSLSVQGRIESSKGDDYIRGIGTQSETYDVAILALSPVTTEGRAVMDHFYTYFQSRGRWGVVPVEDFGNDVMRDLYIIPIEAGGSNLPPFIDMLEYCSIETPRKEHMVLLALVAKLPEVKPPLPTTEHFERFPTSEIAAAQIAQPAQPANGPANTVNPHAPQYSPMTSSFPPQPQGQYGNPFAPPPATLPTPQQSQHLQQPLPPALAPPAVPRHHLIPHALEILGPHIDEPVIVQILETNLSSNQVVSETIMNNLRHICDENPEARTDVHVLSEHLRRKAQGTGSS